MTEKQFSTVHVVTATEAQNKFGAMLKRAYASAEHLIIERDGIPVAALIPIADYQRLAKGTPALDREQALRDLSAFLERIHARLPDVDEEEANRLIDQAVRETRRARARRRITGKHK